MKVAPVHLNSAIAWLFMVGSACFVLGSVPAYLNAVGGWLDGVTYFIGSLFFTTASFAQLLQCQSPAMTEVDAEDQAIPRRVRLRAWLPHDRAWLAAVTQFPGTLCFNVSTLAALVHNASVEQKDRLVWRPDLYGSTLFLVASVLGILAVGRFVSFGPRSLPLRIAWWNMTGSILFMASALASYILPTGDVVDVRISVVGTLTGAVCFLIGAALMFPAWRATVSQASIPSTGKHP